MSGKSRVMLALAAAGTAAVAVGVAVAVGSSASGATGSTSKTSQVTVHRSTQDPDQVRRYWTPQRLKQADDHTRSRTGPQF